MENFTTDLEIFDRFGFARGGFAIVHKARLRVRNAPNGRIVAVKFLDLRKITQEGDKTSSSDKCKMLNRWWREMRAALTVSHPNILPILGFCDNPDPDYREFVGLVLPFCEKGDASSYVRKNPDVDRMRLLVEIGAAMFALHSAQPPVVHGDIKASNVLIGDDGRAYLSDFGLSRIHEIEGFTTENVMGTCRWMAVELLRGIAWDQQVCITTKSDVWVFWMTILEILTGRPPFSELRKDGAVFLAIVTKHGRPTRPRDCSIDDELWFLLECCWRDSVSRPDAGHVCLALNIICADKWMELVSFSIASILDGTCDDIVLSLQRDAASEGPLPYKCKWLNCTRSFHSIDECIGHEYEELSMGIACSNFL